MKKKGLLIFFCGLLCLMAACGEQETAASGRDIVLLEPVKDAVNTEAAAYRDLLNARSYSAVVVPETTVYAFKTGAYVTDFAFYPGETVPAGEVLASADTSSLDRQIASLRQMLENLTTQYTEYCASEVSEEKKERQRQLYELEYGYQSECLAVLEKEREKLVLSAEGDGVLAAVVGNGADAFYSPAERPVAVLADEERLIIQCDYISKAAIAEAADVYAFVNGKRYEAIYQPIEADDYSRLLAEGKLCSTFVLPDPEISAGDFAVLVVVKEKREQALSVSKDALHKDREGNFVYVEQENGIVRRSIRLGMSDGVYTEITDGLSCGEMVLLPDNVSYGSRTAELFRDDYGTSFDEKGALYYPSTTAVHNPVVYGTVYLEEMKVALYQHVEAGEVIAAVSVKADELVIKRIRTELERARERLADLIAAGAEESVAAAKQEEADRLAEQLAAMERDAAVTEITADVSGVVVWRQELSEADIISAGSAVVEIADESTCYVMVEDKKHLLNYGNTVDIAYQNQAGENRNVQGTVVSIYGTNIPAGLQSNTAMILLPAENIPDMVVSNEGNGWWNIYRYRVTATVRRMGNVVMVPKAAVKTVSGRTYVNVMEEDGSILTRSFLAGGSNTQYYWVIDGLTEGMKVCLE